MTKVDWCVCSYVCANKSYLLLFCQNIYCALMNTSLFDFAVLNLHFSCFCSPPGLIWSRYSLVIIPKNWNLFAVNFFVGSAGASQLYRIWRCVCVCVSAEARVIINLSTTDSGSGVPACIISAEMI